MLKYGRFAGDVEVWTYPSRWNEVFTSKPHRREGGDRDLPMCQQCGGWGHNRTTCKTPPGKALTVGLVLKSCWGYFDFKQQSYS